MRIATLVNTGIFVVMIAGGVIAGACSSPAATGDDDDDDDSKSSSGTSGKGTSGGTSGKLPDGGDDPNNPNPSPTGSSTTGIPDVPLPEGSTPRAVLVARTTTIPTCTAFVDVAAGPVKSIAAAVTAAKNGDVICVAEGTYSGEKLTPGAKFFTIAGGFQTGKDFKVRDSAKYITKVKGAGTGAFYKATDDAVPKAGQLTAFDGLEISNYAQGIVRATYFGGQVDITNNNFHDNDCKSGGAIGGGVFLSNVKSTIKGNVFTNNKCGRGGAVALDDTLNKNEVTFANNLVQGNSGNQPEIAHGGGVYLFGNKLTITANIFIDNDVISWGGGLFVGAYNGGGIFTNATLSWNVFRNNKAGIRGGGFFCDDAATCTGEHDIFDGNCNGNLYVDSGSNGDQGTKGSWSYMTNVNAKGDGCNGGGPGFVLDHGNDAADNYKITNSLFFGNGKDFVTACETGCDAISVAVSSSMASTSISNGGVDVTFGGGMVTPSNPQFVDPAKGDYHLKSANGHWTPTGYVNDTDSSPALGKGAGTAASNPAKAGTKPELGAYGNSSEASYTQ